MTPELIPSLILLLTAAVWIGYDCWAIRYKRISMCEDCRRLNRCSNALFVLLVIALFVHIFGIEWLPKCWTHP